MSQAGAVLLVETARKVGLDQAISAALTPWRRARAVHDPGKILLDVALAVALGGDGLADVAMLRAEPVIVDLDGVLVLAHSEKQDATATWKKTFGHHPLMGFVDHGSGGSGEPVAGLLRPGNAGSNTAADHITTTQLALAQLPKQYRRGRRTLTVPTPPAVLMSSSPGSPSGVGGCRTRSA